MKKLGLLLISSAFLFVGCGSKNEAAKQKEDTTKTSIATTITSSTKVNSSSKSEASSSEASTIKDSSSNETACSTETSSTTPPINSTSLSTDNSSSPSKSTTSTSSSAVTDNTEVPATTQMSAEKPTVTNEFPYAVDPGRFNTPTTFQFKGMNVPASATLENNNGQVILTSTPKSGGEATVYTASIETIPTTSIRIFSYAGNAIRTVKVNTKINLLNKLSSANTPDESGSLYVFENSNGGLSLITPNYAGNVSGGQSDVMLEAVH